MVEFVRFQPYVIEGFIFLLSKWVWWVAGDYNRGDFSVVKSLVVEIVEIVEIVLVTAGVS